MAKKSLKTSRRKNFGNNNKAWINIEVSEDRRQAFLRELCFGGDSSLEEEDLVVALEELYHITAGIDGDVLERIVRQAQTAPHKEFFGLGDIVIAREVPPRPASNGRVQYKFLDMLARRVDLPYLELKAAFEKKDLASVIEQDLKVRSVRPGEELAVLLPAHKGAPGQDIFGNITTMVPAPENVQIKAGPNVQDEQDRFISEVYGYVCVANNEISVLPPVWISPDKMEIHFIHFPQVGPQFLPEIDWLEQILEREQIQQEIPIQTVNRLNRYLMDQRTKKGTFLLARGTPPEAGHDARLESRFRPDEHKTTIGVQSGQLVAEVIPPTKGTPGLNLRGEEIPSQSGQMLPFKSDENVRIEYEGDQPKFFYAKIDGNARIHTNTVEVYPVLRIDGDVDETTGNIDAVKDVVITGSVRAGLKVNATGSITIGKNIEDGASVNARGDILVAQGILGKNTRAIALGSVQARFIQDSSVMARRNVILGEYAHNARIRAGEKLIIQSGDAPRSGSLVGGEATATGGVEVETLGAPEDDATLVGIGPDLEIEAKLKKLREGVDFYNENILRIFRTLNIQSIDLTQVRELLAKTPPWRKKPIVDMLMKLRTLVARREESLQKQKDLEAKRVRTLQGSEVQVNNKAFANAQIRIGKESYTLEQDLEQSVFFLDTDGINWRQLSGEDQQDEIFPAEES